VVEGFGGDFSSGLRRKRGSIWDDVGFGFFFGGAVGSSLKLLVLRL
jgi:hypothetical protein